MKSIISIFLLLIWLLFLPPGILSAQATGCDDLIALADDLADPDYGEDLQSFFAGLELGEGYKVWKFVKSRKPTFVKNIDVMNDIGFLLSNESRLGITIDELSEIIDALDNAAQYGKPFPEVIQNLRHAEIYADVPGLNEVFTALKKVSPRGSFHVGANWVLEWLRRYGDSFPLVPEFMKFEFDIAFGSPWQPPPRYTDIYYRDFNNGIRYILEFKSVAPSNVFSGNLPTQFAKDLENANSLDEIKWIYDRSKLPNGLDPDSIIPNIVTDQITIDSYLGIPPGQHGTIEQFRELIRQNFDNIFQVW